MTWKYQDGNRIRHQSYWSLGITIKEQTVTRESPGNGCETIYERILDDKVFEKGWLGSLSFIQLLSDIAPKKLPTFNLG